MKNLIKLMSVMLFISLMLTGCIGDKNEDNTKKSLETYLQSEENTKYVYDGSGSEYAGFDSWVDYKAEGTLQLRTNNSGTEMVKVYKVADGKLTLSFMRPETYYRENFLNENPNSTEVVLMEPIQTGTSWKLETGEERSITNTEAEVETPSGNYKAVEVTTVYEDSTTKDYYVQGIGLVKSVFTGTDEFEVTSVLSSIEKDQKLKQTVNLYYPNLEEDKYYYKEVDLLFATNDEPKDIFTKAYKENKPEKAEIVFSENASINKFSFDFENGIVKLDMNEAFLQDMNAGSAYESMILQSMAATFGNYCYGDKLTLTVDGKPYESGHILLDEENYIQSQIEQEVTEVE